MTVRTLSSSSSSSSSSFESKMMYPDTRIFIDGAWYDGAGGKTADAHHPATGAIIGQHAMAGTVKYDIKA